jgi:hypothetical protein
MNSIQVLNALERELKLLEDFICLSEEQLLLLADEDLESFDSLLRRRSELMTELTAVEANLASWISQVRNDPSVSPEIMRQMRSVNEEIVRMANHIVQIDEHTHDQLDIINTRRG